ncbi:LOW QUALITY PROTEIN: carboxypeptidase O [Petaurus breviceps papuanus]|uniref:LOW QUALITY PROTEIN: carboxypeptidase O n=1 Tax=Petaurus breviceps papuanus TaxID=3040969 RepID=UPI0036DF1BA0
MKPEPGTRLKVGPRQLYYLCRRMNKVLWTLYLLRILVPQRFGLKVQYDGTLSNNGHGVLEEKLSPRSNLEDYNHKKYHPIEEIYKWMIQIEKRYSGVVTQHFLGMAYEARLMYYLKVSERAATCRKIIWIDCGVHARDIISPKSSRCFYLFICRFYKTDRRIIRFLRKLDDFCILPVLSIDGYVYSWRANRLWRKSRASHNNGTCFGTDLNRNFNSSWCECKASKNCKHMTFCGTGPFSVPETKAISSLIKGRKDSILCYLSIHSYGQLILIPYGYTKKRPRNYAELIRIGQKAAKELKAKHGSNYKVGSTSEILYFLFGSSRDWAYDMGIPFAYMFELRDNGTYKFALPENQIQPTCEETTAAVLAMLDEIFKKEWGSDKAVMLSPTTVGLVGLSVFLSFILFF